MNIEDAKKIISAIEKIDNGCPYCIDDFCNELNILFPNLQFHRDLDYDGYGEKVDVEEV